VERLRPDRRGSVVHPYRRIAQPDLVDLTVQPAWIQSWDCRPTSTKLQPRARDPWITLDSGLLADSGRVPVRSAHIRSAAAVQPAIMRSHSKANQVEASQVHRIASVSCLCVRRRLGCGSVRRCVDQVARGSRRFFPLGGPRPGDCSRRRWPDPRLPRRWTVSGGRCGGSVRRVRRLRPRVE
jgi:hypothetical protein